MSGWRIGTFEGLGKILDHLVAAKEIGTTHEINGKYILVNSKKVNEPVTTGRFTNVSHSFEEGHANVYRFRYEDNQVLEFSQGGIWQLDTSIFEPHIYTQAFIPSLPGEPLVLYITE